MVINTNIQAQINADNLTASQSRLARSLGRLSSGSKITNPGDDAAGLAVSSKLDAQVQRLGAAKNNVGNAMSFTQTQDGYLGKVAKALNRMSELSLLAQDVTKTDGDRSLYQREFEQLNQYIQDASTKDFNGVSLFSAASLSVTTDDKTASFGMDGVNLSYLKSLKSVSENSTLAEIGQATGTAITDGNLNVTSGANTFSVSVSTTDTLKSLFAKLHAVEPSLNGSFDPVTGKISLTGSGSTALIITETPAAGSSAATNFLESSGLSNGNGLALGGSTNKSVSGTASSATASTLLSALTPAMHDGAITVGSVTVPVNVATDTLQTLFNKLHAADSNLSGSVDSSGRVSLTTTGSSPLIVTDTGSNFLTTTGLSSGNSMVLGNSSGSASSVAIPSSAPNISTMAGAKAALSAVVDGISSLAADRARVGAYQQRLNYVADQLTVSKQNMSAASSRIQDVDVADEATEYAKQNILVQSGTAMLAQANQMPQSVLRLLQ